MWEFKAAEPVGRIAAAHAASCALVCAGERTVHVLDEGGTVCGRFKAGQLVRCLDVGGGSVLTALAGTAIIYAFSPSGDFEWRVELGGPVTAYAVGQSGEFLAAVSEAGWLYTYSAVTRERRVAPIGFPMTAIVVRDADARRIVVVGAKGQLAQLDGQGKTQWQKDLGFRAESVSADATGDRVFVAGGRRGLLVFDAAGREAGKVAPGGDVQRVEAGPRGFPAMVELAEGRLALIDEGGQVVWERPGPKPAGTWAYGAAGGCLVVAETDRRVVAYRVATAGDEPAEAPRPAAAGPSKDQEPAEPGADDYLAIEEAMAADAPAPAAAAAAPRNTDRNLLWKKRLHDALLPIRPGLLRSSADGAFLLVGLADGQVAVLDRQGAPVLRHRVVEAAEVVPAAFIEAVGLHAGRSLHVLQPATGDVREIGLGEADLLGIGCADDLSVAYTLEDGGWLCRLGQGGEAAWRRPVGDEARTLLVSATGRTVLVVDADGRLRYYDPQGTLQRKLRFADGDRHHPVVVGDDFSAFVAPRGRLTVLDGTGRQAWSRRLFEPIVRVDRLGGALAAYGENALCAVADVRAGTVWDFAPPPGAVLLRTPSEGGPVVLHAAGPHLTVFAGREAALEPRWHCLCDADVKQFEADAEARCIVAAADGKLYRFEHRE